MATFEIDDSTKWALLSLVGDRIRQIEDNIIVRRSRGWGECGSSLQLEHMTALQNSLNRQFQVAASGMDKMEAKALARQRATAREAKDWPEADRLRNLLIEGGWHVRDTLDGFELSQGVGHGKGQG